MSRLRDAVADFLYRESEMLDRGDYDAWLDLFAADGVYWVPSEPEQTDPLNRVSIVYEDRALLGMRIGRARSSDAHGLERPVRTSRLVGNIRVVGESAGGVESGARFHLLEWHKERHRAFAGSYRHSLVRHDAGWKIRQKRVDLVDVEGAHASIQIIL